MRKEIWFDMDGTIADLYGVEGWKDDLDNERVRPYKEARPLVNMQVLARVLNRLAREGYEIGVVSWTAKNGTAEYNERVAEVKRGWIKRHLASVRFERIDIIEYSTPKQIGREGILFDDEEQNRKAWRGQAYDVNDIIGMLRGIE